MAKLRRPKQFLALAAGLFCSVTASGGFGFGLVVNDGRALALASLLAGTALALLLWTYYATRDPNCSGLRKVGVVTFCMSAGLALYSNLSYLLHVLGFPMAIRAIESGTMEGKYWLPPGTLLFAIFCWWNIRDKD